MYARATTWLPTAQQMGLGQISFADLRRAARRSRRGMGQANSGAYTMGGSIPPADSPCYNPSDTFAHFFGVAGADENACLAQNEAGAAITLNPSLSAALAPGLPVGYDTTTGTVEASNTTGATQAQTDAVTAALQSELEAAASGAYNPAASTSANSNALGILALILVGVGVVIIFIGGHR